MAQSNAANQLALQLDVGGLANMIMGMGASGLKQFAQAGVDTHTLGCLLMIAELCPASMACRQQLSLFREEQRKQRRWLYKVVEIGAATNFVVDYLLKTRAGENVLALMSMLDPIFSFHAVSDVVMAIFDKAKVALDHQPGLAQLSAFRHSISGFVRNTHLKDAVFRSHCFLKHLLADDDHCISDLGPWSKSGDPGQAIPDIPTVVSAIIQCDKLIRESSGSSFVVWSGTTGAAWFVTYVREVLGLTVCVIQVGNKLMPFGGNYNDATVYLDLTARESKCELFYRGSVEDYISVQAFESAASWIVDVAKVNYLDIMISRHGIDRWVLETMCAPLALIHLHWIIQRVSQNARNPAPSQVPLTPFFEYHKHALGRRVYAKLRCFGVYKNLKDFELDELVRENEDCRYTFYVDEALVMRPSAKWRERFDQEHDNDNQHMLATPDEFTERGHHVVHVCMWLSTVVSILAFTDWGNSFTGFCADPSIVTSLSRARLQLDKVSMLAHLRAQNAKQRNLPDQIVDSNINGDVLLDAALHLVTSMRKLDYDDFVAPERRMLARCDNGVVLIKSMAVDHKAALRQPTLLSIRPGCILAAAERKDFIINELPTKARDLPKIDTITLSPLSLEALKPAGSIELRHRAMVGRNSVRIETTVCTAEVHVQRIDPISICQNILKAWVLEPNDNHAIDWPAPCVLESFGKSDMGLLTEPTWTRRGDESLPVLDYFQTVLERTEGQWAAFSWEGGYGNDTNAPVTVLIELNDRHLHDPHVLSQQLKLLIKEKSPSDRLNFIPWNVDHDNAGEA